MCFQSSAFRGIQRIVVDLLGLPQAAAERLSTDVMLRFRPAASSRGQAA